MFLLFKENKQCGDDGAQTDRKSTSYKTYALYISTDLCLPPLLKSTTDLLIILLTSKLYTILTGAKKAESIDIFIFFKRFKLNQSCSKLYTILT